MDIQKIYNNLQGKIALDNFKKERDHIRRNKKTAVFLISAFAILYTCMSVDKKLKEKKQII
ncbi:MAG: hypothetical protein GX758_03430 [Tenericutes bacterium]|nr:hypothetical protein [Mycoplasmatota bacterium]